jgi:hypothetical protein
MRPVTTHTPAGGDGAATEDIDHTHRKLAGRVAGCFERLEDVVSELVALHAVHADDILACAKATIAAEQQEAASRE